MTLLRTILLAWLWLALALTVYFVAELVTDSDLTDRPRNWLKAHAPWPIPSLATCCYCLSAHLAWVAVLVVDRAFVHLPLPALWWTSLTGATWLIFRALDN